MKRIPISVSRPSLRVSLVKSRWSVLALSLLLPMLFTQCKTTTKTYKDIEYDAAKLNTPSGHGLVKKDYPFDDSGNYRKDWVKNNTSGRTRSSYAGTQTTTAPVSPAPAPASVSAGALTATAPEGTPAYAGYADAVTFDNPAPAAPSTPAPSSSPTYHTVVSGDTLFALARRYDTSVSEIMQVNGLSGDTIRDGQSLRMP